MGSLCVMLVKPVVATASAWAVVKVSLYIATSVVEISAGSCRDSRSSSLRPSGGSTAIIFGMGDIAGFERLPIEGLGGRRVDDSFQAEDLTFKPVDQLNDVF